MGERTSRQRDGADVELAAHSLFPCVVIGSAVYFPVNKLTRPATYLVPEYSDRTSRRHFERPEPHGRQPCRQVQYEHLRAGDHRLPEHGHVESIRLGRSYFQPGADHRAQRAGHHGHAETLFEEAHK